MKRLLLFLSCLIFILGCKKKEIPSSTTGEPVFFFKGTIDTSDVNLIAGIDGIYMFSDYYKDTQNLITLKSIFAPQSCNTCEPYLSFELKDADISSTNGLSMPIAQLLASGATFNSYSLDSVITTINVENFTFTPDGNSILGTYLWDFGDGTPTSTLTSPTHIFSGTGTKIVRLIRNVQGLIDTMSNAINISDSTCRPQFTYTIDSITNSVFVNASSGFTNYQWNYGDMHIGNGQNDSNTYTNLGSYLITLTATSNQCGNVDFKKKVNLSNPIFGVNANYSYSTSLSTAVSLTPRLNKSAFIITYIKNGKIYKSFKNIKGINQSGNPVFTFTNVAMYPNNEKGQKTLKVSGTVDTYLYNFVNANDSIRIVSDKVTIAAAYP